MNILFLTRRFYPDVGGVETHALEVAKCLIRDGHTVTIIAERPQESKLWQSGYNSDIALGREIWVDFRGKNTKLEIQTDQKRKNTLPNDFGNSSRKIILYHLPNVKNNRTKKFIIWMWLWKNRQIIKNADIVHCHDVFFWYFPFRFIYRSKKVFTTFHGYEGVYPPTKKAILIRKLSEKLSFGNICVGKFIEKWYGTKADLITYGAIPTEECQMSNIKYPISNVGRKLKILFVGRVEEDTGVGLYLEALEKLENRKIRFDFRACGDGVLRKEAEKYGKVLGFVSNVGDYIQQADIVLASSYLSIIQALAYRKLVISAYNNPLKEDYLKMTPFAPWIQVFNTSDDIVSFINAHRNSEGQHLDVMAQNWAKKQTWEKVTQVYYNLWKYEG
jgi:glycosyltransferase involved in cell wall biosynthesis